MSIRELRLMNESERMEWYKNVNGKDLTIVLKNEGIKSIYKMKKAEKLAIVIELVENKVEDEVIEKVVDDTRKLNEEINARQSYKEEFEQTLCARWQAKEITWEEFKQAIIKYNISIPINVTDEEDTKDILNRNYDMYSAYEHYDDENNIYYSVLNRDFQWSNVFRIDGKYIYYDWEEQQMYELNTVDKDCIHQLAFGFDENGHYTLLVYKNYELLGTYRYGDIDDIKRLIEYDDRLYYDDLEKYEELLKLLKTQYYEYYKTIRIDIMLHNKLKIEKYAQFVIDKLN